jgi:hypothetical protein
MTETELLGSITKGLTQGGLSSAEASELAAGLSVTPSFRQLLSYDLEAGARLAIAQAADVATPIVRERERRAQAEQAAREAAAMQQQSERSAKIGRAVVDPAFDKLWAELSPDEHRQAWKEYLARKRSDPTYRLQ